MAAPTALDGALPIQARPGEVSDAELDRVLKEVPRGALTLCSLAVGILMACWLAIYFGVFLPRGPVN